MPAMSVDLDVLLDVATELLMGAVTLRDLAGAMPSRVLANCPPDLAGRLMSHRYQQAFDALPEVVRTAAQMRVAEDPGIVAARAIDAAWREGHG